jgi:replicative DNA helicase
MTLMRKHEMTEHQISEFYDNEVMYNFADWVKNYKTCDPEDPFVCCTHYATGYPEIDIKLNGGFTGGLHCIGAAHGIGTSTWVQQMAMQMSKMGTWVLMFALDMPTQSVVAKTISRQTFLDKKSPSLYYVKTPHEITDVNCRKSYTQEEWETVNNAAEKVAALSAKVRVIGHDTELWTIDNVEKYVLDWMTVNLIRPVVIIDYLQLIAPSKSVRRYSDKRIAEYNIARLNALADYYSIPIILVHHLNNISDKTPVTLASFNSVNSLVYTCETVMGMQLKGVGEAGFDSNKAKAESPRLVDIKFLKDSYGYTGVNVSYEFNCNYSCFIERPV